jgi:hypothetical protein
MPLPVVAQESVRGLIMVQPKISRENEDAPQESTEDGGSRLEETMGRNKITMNKRPKIRTARLEGRISEEENRMITKKAKKYTKSKKFPKGNKTEFIVLACDTYNQ